MGYYHEGNIGKPGRPGEPGMELSLGKPYVAALNQIEAIYY